MHDIYLKDLDSVEIEVQRVEQDNGLSPMERVVIKGRNNYAARDFYIVLEQDTGADQLPVNYIDKRHSQPQKVGERVHPDVLDEVIDAISANRAKRAHDLA